MIGRLTGKPDILGSTLIFDVNGVGYEVQTGLNTLASLNGKSTTTIEICTIVREDSFQLFGFRSTEEKHLFTLLLSVSGVGPRTALAIVDRGVGPVITAVQQADVSFFTTIPRLGKKNAQKIIIELKSKLGDSTELNLGDDTLLQSEAGQALQTLGYDEQSITKTLSTLPLANLSAQDAVKQALKALGTR